MPSVKCLLCGDDLVFPDYIHEQYDGEVRCENCLGRLHLVLDGSKVRKYKVVSEPKTYTFADFAKRIQQNLEKQKQGEK